MEDDSVQEVSFKSYITEGGATTQTPTPAVEPIAAPQVSTETVPAQDAKVSGVATDGSAASAAPPVEPEAPKQVRFEDVLAKYGWQVDGADPEALYETSAEYIKKGIELQSEVARRDMEIEELRARLANQSASPAQQSQPVQQQPVAQPEPPKQSRYGLINEPHAATREYVTKSSSGTWVVKPEYATSSVAFAAAEEWNKYEQQAADRANLIIRNPKAVWDDEVKPEVEQMVEQRARLIVEEFYKKQEQEAQARAAQEAQFRAEQEAMSAMARFDQEHAKEFYVHDASGRPLTAFGSNQPIKTTFFQQFEAAYVQYANDPDFARLPQHKIAQLAYDFTKAQSPALAQAQLQSAAPVKTPQQIAAETVEKKDRFVDNRQAPAKAPVNMQPASLEDMSIPTGAHFRDFILQDQENAGNPVWEQMRSR